MQNGGCKLKKQSLTNLNKYLCQDDLNIIVSVLRRFKYDGFYAGTEAKDFKQDIPFPGIYVLVRQKVIEYIGTAKDVMKRLYNQKVLDGHDIIVIDTSGRTNRQRIETCLVSLINPGKNKIKTIYGKRKY